MAEQLALLEVDSVRVKGKLEPDVIYMIVGRAEVLTSSEFAPLQNHWGAALVCYRKQDWAGARKLMRRAYAIARDSVCLVCYTNLH